MPNQETSAKRKKTGKPQRRPGRPRASDSSLQEDPRSRLEKVAIQVFSQHGYDAVSTGEVARAAGLSQPLVHYHFGSKEQLWKAAMTLLMRDLGARFPVNMGELKDLGPVERLKVITRRFITMSSSDPTLARIMMHESLARSDRLSWLVEHFLKRAYAEFDEAIRAGIDQGLIRDIPLYAVANIIVNASSFIFACDALIDQIYGVDVTGPDRVDELSDAIMDILFRGLLSPT
ncbi:MAG: TetR/AcrR family transcriptional regulator [Rhodobacter sp.]|nr:TetR/AcrR family transcriptional regulator [Paracoccaceae bacterium]MCC0077135.1 TetR/AcrR family transcriptional regulator [Rhodobacter sp.]